MVSGLDFPSNHPMVLELALRGRSKLLLTGFILGEISGVLKRKFGRHQEWAVRATRTLLNVAAVLNRRA